MAQERITEALSHLQDDWPLRVLLSALAEGVAELAALLGGRGPKTPAGIPHENPGHRGGDA